MRVSIAKTRIIGLWLVIALLLSGCSVVRVAYIQAPMLGWWWLDGYFDFTSEQEPRVKVALNEWFDWHRRTQLPDYAALLAAAQLQVMQPATPEQVCRWYDDLRGRIAVAVVHGVPLAVDMVSGLSAEQLQQLERRYEKSNQKFQGEFMQARAEERAKASLRRTVERVEMLYGRIDERQRQMLVDALAASPFDPAQWYGERQALQRETLQTLRQLQARPQTPADRAAQEARLAQLAARLQSSTNPEYRAYQQRLTDYNCALVARFHNSTTPTQRQAARARLKGWEEDLRALAGLPAVSALSAERSL
jgi:hypothetical protein